MDIVKAIKNYLSIIESDYPEDQAIERIVASLDELATLNHRIQYFADDNEYPEPPEKDQQNTIEKVKKRFPSLGFYNIAGEIGDKIAECDIHVGDAISDIAEIADELNEVLWYLENTSKDNGLFYYRLGFMTHWGRHMRELQLYLHDLLW